MAESSEKNPKRPKHDIPETSKDSSMAETLEKNPESPKQNPETSNDSMMAEPAEHQSIGDPPKENAAIKLKHAIEALRLVNSDGAAVIEVVPNELKILSGSDNEFKLLGYLDVKESRVMHINCKKSIKKMVSLIEIVGILDPLNQSDRLSIRHVDGSKELTFKLGERCENSAQVIKAVEDDFGLEAYGPEAERRKYVTVTVHVKDVKKIIQQVEEANTSEVMFEIANGTVSIKVGQHEPVTYEYNSENNVDVEGWKRCAQFGHCESLSKALLEADEVRLCLGVDQDNLILRFKLGELGTLSYVMAIVGPGRGESIDPSAEKPETSTSHPASASGADQ